MKVAFFSNFLNPHQIPLCKALYDKCMGQFRFIATEPISEERLSMYFSDCSHDYPFVISSFRGEKEYTEAKQWADTSDSVIIGSAPNYWIEKRIRCNQLTFRYCERLFKNGRQKILNPRVFRATYLNHIRFRRKNMYMLCASAYTAADCHFIGTYRNKAFRWGYFTEVKPIDADMILAQKKPRTLLWAGRLIEFKHPDDALVIAERLKNDGIDYHMQIIGTGAMEPLLRNKIREKDLSVDLLGGMSPDEVRTYMESAPIFLMTSDFGEGWGAVINEAMSSACAVVASSAAGATPVLIQSGENGLIYENSNLEDLYVKTKTLLCEEAMTHILGKAAYRTMADQWNGANAADRLLALTECILSGGRPQELFDNGVCSLAPVLKQHWFIRGDQ